MLAPFLLLLQTCNIGKQGRRDRKAGVPHPSQIYRRGKSHLPPPLYRGLCLIIHHTLDFGINIGLRLLIFEKFWREKK